LIALLIRLDSPGPVLFLQRRYGFNQQAFRIFKFRTMTTTDDGDVIARRQRNDPRITRIGACCGAIISTSCRNCSTSSPARCPWSGRVRMRWRMITSSSARSRSMRAATTSSPASPAGPRSTACAARPTPTTRWPSAYIAYDHWYIDNWSFWLEFASPRHPAAHDGPKAKISEIHGGDPVDAIQAHIELTGRVRADLADLLGSRSRASEILNRKRPLTVAMIHKLNVQWGIPAEILVQPYQVK
jgi:hypothetical protein